MAWKEWLEAVFYFVGIGAAIISVLQYRRNSRLQRMRWIFDLYTSFYRSPELRKMRTQIDLGRTDFVKREGNAEEMAELDDFLNFFEFVAYLREQEELDDDEVRSMFDYTLRKLARNKALAGYVGKPEYGYEKLPKLLQKLGYDNQDGS